MNFYINNNTCLNKYNNEFILEYNYLDTLIDLAIATVVHYGLRSLWLFTCNVSIAGNHKWLVEQNGTTILVDVKSKFIIKDWILQLEIVSTDKYLGELVIRKKGFFICVEYAKITIHFGWKCAWKCWKHPFWSWNSVLQQNQVHFPNNPVQQGYRSCTTLWTIGRINLLLMKISLEAGIRNLNEMSKRIVRIWNPY